MQRIFPETPILRPLVPAALLASLLLLLIACPRPVSAAVAFRVKRNGCADTPAKERKGKVIIERYGDCDAGTAVTLYTLQYEGHTWPGGTKWALWADEPSREISATDVIWEFFRAHPKRD
ncbi:MAG: hypothetical protein ACM33C_03620 [Syntrophaceae bacterium]